MLKNKIAIAIDGLTLKNLIALIIQKLPTTKLYFFVKNSTANFKNQLKCANN